MRLQKFSRLSATFALAFVPMVVSGTASAQKLSYRVSDFKGWKQSVFLTTGPYRVVVVPAIGGRIMEYSVNGSGSVWTNPALHGKVQPLDPKVWNNYGGYKTWPAPQSRWGWPPDPRLDAAPATVTPWRVNGRLHGLHIRGQNSPASGIAFEKWVRLDPKSGRLTLKQTMRALTTNAKPVQWGLWDITQARSEGRIVVPLDPGHRSEEGVYFFDEKARKSKQWKTRDGLLLVQNRGEVVKYGVKTDGGWMAWLSGTTAYIKRFPRMLPGFPYPDRNSVAQVYVNGSDLPYTEMEITGPVLTLPPGASTSFTEEWRLVRLPRPVRTEADALAAIRFLGRASHLRPYRNGVILPRKRQANRF